MTPLLRPLDQLDYDPAELRHWIEEDAAFRSTHPHAKGGPLRARDGAIAPVHPYMRLDLNTDRNGPVPDAAPELGPCWLWTGSTTNGYGYIRIGKRKVQAYRVNYERWVGPIPAALEGQRVLLDHICRVRPCVRPDHMRIATYAINAQNSDKHPAVVRAAADSCPEGHPYDEANTYITPGTSWRQCRACRRERRRTEGDLRRRATATHCANGHPWEGNTRYTKAGARVCTQCQREAQTRLRQRRAEARDMGEPRTR